MSSSSCTSSLRSNDLQMGVMLKDKQSLRVVRLIVPSMQHGNNIPGWSWIDTTGTRGWTMVPTILGDFRFLSEEEVKRMDKEDFEG